MRTEIKFINFHLVLIIFIGVVFSNSVIGGEDSNIGLKAKDYCQLILKVVEAEIDNRQELIAIIQQNENDPTTLAELEELNRQEYDEIKENLYSSFGISASDYVSYMSRHKKEVDQYLLENPDVRDEIDNLSSQLNSLLAQYESLKGLQEENPGPPQQ